MENYSNNSLTSRQAVDPLTGLPEIPKKEDLKPEKKVDQVVETPAIVKKKSGFRKFKDDFIESEVKDVKESIFMDIIMPAIKNTIADGISTFVDMMLFGDSARVTRLDRGGRRGGHISYNSMFESNPRNKVQTRSSRQHVGVAIDDIILGSRVDAERVVQNLIDICSVYGMASVADLYDLVGYTAAYTDHKYGWHDINGYSISRVREGFLLNLPEPKPLDI